MGDYLRPVNPTNGRMSTYWAHNHRNPPSSEAGVDYYCPIGTPVLAAGNGIVADAAGGIAPATGRYVTIDLDDGRRVRYLHLSRWNTSKGKRVTRGQVVGYSGSSGYGSEYFGASNPNDATMIRNTGGPHVHTTLWPHHIYQFGRYPATPTLDFEVYVGGGGAPAGGGSTPFPLPEENNPLTKEDEMPINFYNPANGVTYTMVPGVQIMAHENAFGSRLTNYINTGIWPADETLDARFAAGLRNLNKDHVNWMLGFYGFARFSADTLPAHGAAYSDWINSMNIKQDSDLAEGKAIHGDTAVLRNTTSPGEVGVRNNGQLWDHITVSGAAGGSADVEIDYDKLINGIVAALPSDAVAPSAEEVAVAVREKLRSEPLT